MVIDRSRTKKVLEVALMAGQIMCESNAESYRVEDTMNRILTYSKAEYATAISYSTSIFVFLDDPSFKEGGYSGARRIVSRSNNMNKISQVNQVSRSLLNDEISLDQAYQELVKIRKQPAQYSPLVSSLGVVGLAMSFSILFGGGRLEFFAAFLDGLFLALLYQITNKFYVNEAATNVFQSMMVTLAAYYMQHFWFPDLNVEVVIVSTLMPMVPGTAITNSFRDIFREDYIAGGARAMEAFFNALMIAIGSVVAFAILRRTIW